MSLSSIRHAWFSNVRNDLLAGVVVALALIPEAIAFSIIVGVDPKVGLYASFSIATLIAFFGGRPAMISAATGAMALVMVDLVKSHGLDYLFAATIVAGVLQMLAGWLQLGRLMRFVSRSVVTGFVNALAILIFLAQLPELTNVTWHAYAVTAAGLAIIYGLPRLTRAVPAPLVAIVVLTALSVGFKLPLHTVGDMGQLPDSLPRFLMPDVPWRLATLQIVLPYAITLAMVGLLESLMTATIIDDLTDTRSDKQRECVGQGVANFVTGFIGGMAGCAMIGQSVINVKSGGRTRLSTLAAGVVLLVLVVFLGDWVRQIPMPALVAVMIMVSIGTFSWQSIRTLRSHPKSSSIVMVATVIATVATHDLAKGVLTGVLLSGLFFARKVSRLLTVDAVAVDAGAGAGAGADAGAGAGADAAWRYTVSGQVFFASADQLVQSFDFDQAPARVVIDVRNAHFWDITAIGALDKVVLKFRQAGSVVDVEGLNQPSAAMVEKFSRRDEGGANQPVH